MQAGESNPKVVAILEEGEVAGDPVKVNPNCCGNILPERSGELYGERGRGHVGHFNFFFAFRHACLVIKIQ